MTTQEILYLIVSFLPTILYLMTTLLVYIIVLKWKNKGLKNKLSTAIKISLVLYILSVILFITQIEPPGFDLTPFALVEYTIGFINIACGATFLITTLFIISNVVRMILKRKKEDEKKAIIKQIILLFLIFY